MAKFSPELEAIRKKYRKKAKKEAEKRRVTDPSDSDFRQQERQSARPAKKPMLITTRVEGRFEPEGWDEPFAGKRPPERQKMLDESFGKIKPLTPEMLRRKYGPKRMQVTAKTTGRAVSKDYDAVETFVRSRANRPEKSRLSHYENLKMEPPAKLPMTVRRARKLEKHSPGEDLVGAAMKLVGGKRAVHEHPNVYAAVRTGLEMIPGVSHMTREGALSEDPRKVAKRVGRDAGLGVLYSMAGGMTGEMAGKFGPTIAKAGKKAVGKQLSGALAKFERYKKGMALTEKGARKKIAKMSDRTVKEQSARLKLNKKRLERQRATQMLKEHEEKLKGIESGRPTPKGVKRSEDIARGHRRVKDIYAQHWQDTALKRNTTGRGMYNPRTLREGLTGDDIKRLEKIHGAEFKKITGPQIVNYLNIKHPIPKAMPKPRSTRRRLSAAAGGS